MFTSGTTGKSKIAEFSAFNIESAIDGHSSDFAGVENQRQRVMAAVLPMHHIAGIMSYVLLPQYKLWTVCIGRGAKYMLMDVPVLNPNHIYVVPAVLNSIIKILKTEKVAGKNQIESYWKNLDIFVGAAMIPIEDILFLQSCGFRLNMAYAMTETCGAGLGCNIDIQCPQTIGKPNKNVQCRIQNGEILIKSDAIMKGYYKDPAETAKILKDGWLHTGDLGWCDGQDNYYITGRKKNTIILANGENVNPEEIEAVWSRCEAIQECLVYADDKGICADVYASDQKKAAQFIKDYNDSVPRYHQVYNVVYAETPLEKTASGKLKRKGNKP